MACAGAGAQQHNLTSHMGSAYGCVTCVFSGENHSEKEHEMCLSADERSSELSV